MVSWKNKIQIKVIYLINEYVLFSSLLVITVCVRVLNIPGKESLSQTTQNLDHMCQISWYFLIFLQPGT